MTRLCAQAGTDASGRKVCSHIWLAQMLNCNTKQTFFKKSWDALELARLQEFMCPRWRAELKLVSAPAYIRVWLPVLPDRVLKEFGQIFRTRPNLVRPWASRMQHIYGAITHQFDSIFSVEGRNGARLLVYQDRDVKQLNVFWPLFYFGQGEQQNQLYMDKLEYMETRWATMSPSYVAGGKRDIIPRRPRRKEDPWDCYCHAEGSCDCHCHLQRKCGCVCSRQCKCHCHKTECCTCLVFSQRWCVKCYCHLHRAHCRKVKTCQCRCHKDETLELGWINEFD